MIVIKVLLLAFIQNIAFSITSRSRNRNNMSYHLVAALGSNGIWFLTMRELVKSDLTLQLMLPYMVGTVTGSLVGVKISMFIERWLLASSDDHLKERKHASSQSKEK